MVEEGKAAPAFTLQSDAGEESSTFVIDPDGNVAKIMRRAKPDEHADRVLAALNGARLR